MAAPALRAVGRALAWFAAGLGGIVLLVFATSWIGSAIPRNPGWTEPLPDEPGLVTIMVGSNGVHTELVLPLVTPQMDWRPVFPATDVPDASEPYTHVAVGWGEREVFLNTPTWADLDPVDGVQALIGGDALLHVAHYVRPAPGPDNRPLRLRGDEYARLVARIIAALPPGHLRAGYPGYARHDVFYDALGAYTWRNTCNQWTADTLAAGGVRIGSWSPLAGGVMRWIPRPR
ncbi:DUF2459 domain-containing protein [Qipengyuania sediminis]|uniref:DUF2459 domain-containing protein n=1 Tax=Qipengyuania sediminis TaxID=1532023 RepID=UPI001F1028A4|nr:DUF2459 domain-containing protein [Qipengyuania sediminis]